MKILGIIGGMSPESTATYYTEINRLVNQKKGGNISAPIVMVSVEFEEIVQCQKQSEWQRAGEILAKAGKKLEKEIRELLGRHVAIYALPVAYEFRDKLPTTLVGKVAFRKLEDEEKAKKT